MRWQYGLFGALFALSAGVTWAGEMPAMADLDGRWALVAINGETVETEQVIYFEIKGKIISGYDGCNSFGGYWNEPGRLRATQRACTLSGPELPLALADPRPQLEAATIDGDDLEMPMPDGSGTARFRRQ